jgi:carbamoyl-phosphate synthase large subunit
VFSMDKIPGTEIALGPEMKSTGEVLSVEKDFIKALYKGFIAAKMELPEKGRILASISDHFKDEFIVIAKRMMVLGYQFSATEGTAKSLEAAGIPVETIVKIGAEGKDVLDLIQNNEINWVVNIPNRGKDSRTDGFKIRRAAVEKKIPCLTALDTLSAWVDISESNLKAEDIDIVNICDLTLKIVG